MIKNNFCIKYILLLIVIFASILASGCASVKPSPAINQDHTANGTAFKKKLKFAQDDEYVVLITKKNDSLASLAQKYLGNENKAWLIADFNKIKNIVPKREIVIPLKPQNPSGVYVNGYQTVPILCYHRFGDNGNVKMTISKEKFSQQMQYLKDNGYRVIAMRDMINFIEGKEALPKKAVIITIDDGYRSTYEIAYPVLKKLNFPATLFLYTDFAGAGDAIKWSHAKKMFNSGLMDIQPHSKTHPNMSLQKIMEDKQQYRKRILEEINNPDKRISKRLKTDMHTFAYPFGDTNKMIIDHLKAKKYKLGVTVQPGENPAYAHPYMLQRTMIFGDHTMSEFISALTVFENRDLK